MRFETFQKAHDAVNYIDAIEGRLENTRRRMRAMNPRGWWAEYQAQEEAILAKIVAELGGSVVFDERQAYCNFTDTTFEEIELLSRRRPAPALVA
jgi:hypothetical protein